MTPPTNRPGTVTEHTRLYRLFDLVGRRIGVVAIAALLVVVGLGVGGTLLANTDEPNFDPAGEVFDNLATADLTLRSTSTVLSASFLVEPATGTNALAPEVLREWAAASNGVRSDAANASHLVDRFDTEADATIPAVFSIADAVDDALGGTIDQATDAEVIAALSAVLQEPAPTSFLRFTLAESARIIDVDGVQEWFAPAFMTTVTYDESGFGSSTDAELWLREVQTQFRDGAIHSDSIGVAIDAESAFSDAAEQSAPFIFLAVGLIILLVVAVHRSFWSAVVVGAGLSATTLAYYGTSALIGLKMGSLLLAFIVPIAMISFGVDFYIHGVGRVREMQVEHGYGKSRAYPAGMSAVFTAMLLAVSSSVAAFMANAVSGTEAIIEFGLGAAVALSWAYLLLGQLAPRVTIGLEDYVGPNPRKRFSRPLYILGALVMAVVGGLTVALGAVMPSMGVAALVVFIGFFVAIPAWLTRRRNRRAIARGARMASFTTGAAHGLEPVGTLVGFLARWRFVTIPIVAVVAAFGFAQATQVESGFEIKDFLSTETDFAQSIERTTSHFPSSGEGTSMIFIEGDLTDPAVLASIEDTVQQLDASSADFGRNADGAILVEPHAGDLVRMVMASAVAADLGLVDANQDGLPDTSADTAAVYDYIWANGVPGPDGTVAVKADAVTGIVAPSEAGQATAIVIQVGSYTDGDIIVPVRDALEASAAGLAASDSDITAVATGEVIAEFVSMESFTRSMLVSLPLAALLTFIIASVILRSIRYALVSVVPIALVVIGVYAFMSVAGYAVNVVTATIAAIAVGVGIDFSTHYAVRYREELAATGDRVLAARRAGAGTGGALVLSAVTSVLGFSVMALAPTPIFATFGLLTAVMIVLSLGVAILVLPSLLVFISKDHVVDPKRPTEREAVLVG